MYRTAFTECTGEAMDVDETAAAGAAATEQGTECAHLCQCWHHKVYQTVLALLILRDSPVRLLAANSTVQLTVDSHFR